MAGGTEDVQYRQELTDRIIAARQGMVNLERETTYYERMNELMQSALSSSGREAPDPEAVRIVEARFAQIYDAVVQAIEQANAVYTELSAQNLNPRTNLFTIASPFSITTERALGLRTLALYGLLVGMASLLLVLLTCSIHHYFRREILPASPRREALAAEPQEEKRVEHIAPSPESKVQSPV